MPLKDLNARREYLRRYRAEGKAYASQKRHREAQAQGEAVCACGNRASGRSCGAPVCSECRRIESRVEEWGRQAQGVEDITQYQNYRK